MSNTNLTARKEDLIIEKLGQEVLIYDLKTNKAFSLNETSSLVWKSCDGKTSPEQIAANKQIPLEMVLFAVNELNNLNLFEDKYPKTKQLNRRTILELGIAAGISIPMVLSIVAPTALMAQSVVCGDGLIAGSETCDDGNNVSGDGCSGLCQVEPGFTCVGQPSVCIPQ